MASLKIVAEKGYKEHLLYKHSFLMKPVIICECHLFLEISYFNDSPLLLTIGFIWKDLLQILTCGQKKFEKWRLKSELAKFLVDTEN